jgi:hypothetical protein
MISIPKAAMTQNRLLAAVVHLMGQYILIYALFVKKNMTIILTAE